MLAVAALPFVLVCCRASSSSSGEVLIDNGSRLVPTPDEHPSPLAANAFVDAAAVASPDAATAIVAAQSPKAKCEDIRRNVNALLDRSLACSTDDDCIDIFTSCGLRGMCGVPIAATAKSNVEAAEKPWNDQGCVAITASPCASCMKPPTPECNGGKCSF